MVTKLPHRKRKKIRFMTDEDLLGEDFSNLKDKAKLITSNELMGRSGAQDIEIYQKATTKNLHIITGNASDYKSLQKTHPQFTTGIFGLSGTSRRESIKRLKKLITNKPYHDQWKNKYVLVSSSSANITTYNTSN